jgi:transcriptional regulator of acetoin/glycerol metabolism
MVLAAIRREGGNLSRAARSLGIARTTLYRHIRRSVD